EPEKPAWIGPSFTVIFPFALFASCSVSSAPSRQAATAGMSAKIAHTVAGDLATTKLSSNRVQPVRASSTAGAGAVIDGGATSPIGTKARRGAGCAAAADVTAAGFDRRDATTLSTALMMPRYPVHRHRLPESSTRIRR